MRSRHAIVASGVLGLGLVALGAAGVAGPGEIASPPVRPGGVPGASARQSGERVASIRTGPRDAPELISALGCGACHAGVPAPVEARRAAPVFGSGGRARPPDSLLSVLLASDARRTTASPARMPLFHLSRPEALALTLFLETTRPEGPTGGRERVDRLREEHPTVGPELGRRLFLALDCAGCHAGTGVPAWESAPDLAAEGERARRGWLASWLARPRAVRPFGFHPGTGTRMPDFGLSGQEIRTLVDYLAPPDGGAGAAPTAGLRDAASRPIDPVPVSSGSLSPFRRAEAERLLRRRSACLGCHALAGEGGRVAPDLADLRIRRPDAYVWAMLRDPDGTRPRSVMPRSPEGAARDSLFYRLLTTGEPSSGSPSPAPDGYLDLTAHAFRPPDPWMLEGGPAPGTAGERYRHRCSSCHGAEGGGEGFNARYLPVAPARHADSAAMAARTDARLFNGIHGGGRVLGRSPRMPAFGRSLSREAMWGLVGYVRDRCGCRGPYWYRDRGESGVREPGGPVGTTSTPPAPTGADSTPPPTAGAGSTPPAPAGAGGP